MSQSKQHRVEATAQLFGRVLTAMVTPFDGSNNVDLVETGTTLRENHLEVVEEIAKISARLIANKSSFKFKTQQIETITQKLEEIIE